MKKKKKKVFDSIKAAGKARRDEEIAKYGKLVSLRPGKVFKSKKDYKRNKKVDIENED